MGKRIVTIDAADDRVLKRARCNHRDAILTNTLAEFVIRVLAASASEKISQLDVIGHGRPGQIYVGGAARIHAETHIIGVSPTNGQLYCVNVLRMLTDAFAPDAIVRLHACRVAQGRDGSLLLWQLADLWRVRVQGAVVTQYPDDADRFEGRLYVEASGMASTSATVLQNHSIR